VQLLPIDGPADREDLVTVPVLDTIGFADRLPS
jgi:hypothetical protein